ncbi:helix-turn-helix domain protein [Mycobacterium kansasii 732]|nr:helix-turn-helix domain protein [Mycobacterium kansasii 732]
MSLEEHKRRERAQAIGLFRYQLICPALDEGLSTKQRGKLVREIAAATHTDPFGNQTRVSRETLDRWIRRYRGGGFEALVPAPRRLAARTDAQVLELAASLKRENPPAPWRRWPASCAPRPGGRPLSRPCCVISTDWS